ncbi:MAG TPA: helix-turn-helix domain-containing protein [Pseudogracilibacillus sp.]|nr:helix-turn-helix domain-containing protein [Pseudogracilibacillus sp.]
MSIGENIRKVRKEKKLTQEKLSKKMGISRSYLSDVENDRYNPSSKTLNMFADKLDVSMLYLTTGKKSIEDLTDEEIGKSLKNAFRSNKEDMQSSLKEKLRKVLDTELSYSEVNYLNNVMNILGLSKDNDINLITAALVTINNFIVLKDNNIDKKELNEIIDTEFDEMKEMFTQRLIKDGE